jgi:hypothetical protein
LPLADFGVWLSAGELARFRRARLVTATGSGR